MPKTTTKIPVLQLTLLPVFPPLSKPLKNIPGPLQTLLIIQTTLDKLTVQYKQPIPSVHLILKIKIKNIP